MNRKGTMLDTELGRIVEFQDPPIACLQDNADVARIEQATVDLMRLIKALVWTREPDGFACVLLSFVRAIYWMGVQMGRRQRGLTFVVAPDEEGG